MSDWSEITRQILEERGASRFYSNVFYRESVDSSNEWVKELGEVHFPEGTVGIADAQTAGKGRRGRTWVSPSGENIYFSLLLRPEFSRGRNSLRSMPPHSHLSWDSRLRRQSAK